MKTAISLLVVMLFVGVSEAQAPPPSPLYVVGSGTVQHFAAWDQDLFQRLKQDYINVGADSMSAGMAAYFNTKAAGEARFVDALEEIRSLDPSRFDEILSRHGVVTNR